MKASKTYGQFILLLLAVFVPRLAFSDLTGSYAPDANTIFLLHLNEPAGSSVTTNVGSLGGNFYSVNYSTESANPPVVATMLGGTSYSTNSPTAISFNNCETNTTAGYELGYDYNRDGKYEADDGSASVDFLAMTNLNIGNGGQTPFTLEAIIQPTTTAGNQEIICTDSGGYPSRAFQFRITSGELQFQFIANSQALAASIPTTGPNAFAAGTWYHVAFTYNGTNGTLYWTKLDPSVGAANILTTGPLTMGTSDGAVAGPLVIGNRGRPTGTETFLGQIDDVRISSVARAANQMQFYSPLVTITQNPISQNIDYNEKVTFSVGASSLTTLGYQWYFNSNGIAGATNSSYAITNVAAANAGYYNAIVTNTSGNATTSSPALLVVGAANFLTHRYSFTNDDTDSIGGADGTNFGDATVSGGKLVLDGTAGTYMQLPGNLFNATNATALTVEFWASLDANSDNAYVFSFGYTNELLGSGIVGINYASYSPHNATGQGLFISPSDYEFEEEAVASNTLDDLNMHVDCVIDPPDQTLAIYTNGVLEAINTNLTVGLANVNDVLSYIGASLNAADPYLNASIDELRIYSGALSPLSIQQTDAQGPDIPLANGPAQFVTQPTSVITAPGLTATFTATAVGYLPITYQWFTNGTPVPGATGTTFSFTTVIGDNNSTVVCQAANTIGATTYVAKTSPVTLVVFNPSALVWLGQNSAVWDTSSLNWSNSGSATPVAYTNLDGAVFNDVGSGQPNVDLELTLSPLALMVDSAANYTLFSSSANGSLTGPGTLTKSDTGTLIMDVTNSMTGPVTIDGGVLQIGNGDTLGAIASPVTNNASLVLDRSDATTLPAPIYGTGSVTMNGGNVTASGSNDYSGPTFINSGITYLQNGAGLGAPSGAISVASGAQLYITGNVDVGGNPLALVGAGDGNGALRKGGAGVTIFYGPVSLTSDTTLGVDGGATLDLTNSAGINGASANANLTFAGSGAANITGPLSLGSGSLTVNGGTWTVAPNNSFSGLSTINGGSLRITGSGSLGSVPASFNASQVTLDGGALESGSNVTLADGNIGISLENNSTLTTDTNTTFVISNQITLPSYLNLTKTGPGTLVLEGPQDLAGYLYIDSGSVSAADGMTVIVSTEVLADMNVGAGSPSIFQSDNTGGSSTLGLNGAAGSITVAPDISMAGRGPVVPNIENLAGDNTISGNITINPGGNYYFQSDAGTLTFSAPLPYVVTTVGSTRNFYFSGAGTVAATGGIQDPVGATTIPVNVTVSGPGILSLPTANTYSGTTLVNGGELILTGSLSTNTVTVAGGLLAGEGGIGGAVTVESGGSIEAGTTNTIGTLTITNTLALAGNTLVKLNQSTMSSDLFNGLTGVNYGGTLTVTNLAGTLATGDHFTLFNTAASSGNFSGITGSPGAGLAYSFTNGVLSVVAGAAENPTNILFSLSGDTLSLSWPADHLGWILQSQTNGLNVGITVNWVDVPGSGSVTSTNLTVNRSNPTVFYRLRSP